MSMMGAMLDAAGLQRVLDEAPFHRWLGVRVERVGEDAIELSVPWREEIVSNPKARSVHGGVLAALVDLAADQAIAAKLGHALPTIDLRADFHRPALPGRLKARGEVIKLGRTVVTADARVFDEAGALVASGRAVYLNQQGGGT